MKYKGKFIENKIIESVETKKKASFLGNDLMIVSYEDGTTEEFNSKVFEKVVSDEICDATTLQSKANDFIIEEIIGMLYEYNVKFFDIDYILSTTSGTYNKRIEETSDILWGNTFLKRKTMDSLRIQKDGLSKKTGRN